MLSFLICSFQRERERRGREREMGLWVIARAVLSLSGFPEDQDFKRKASLLYHRVVKKPIMISSPNGEMLSAFTYMLKWFCVYTIKGYHKNACSLWTRQRSLRYREEEIPKRFCLVGFHFSCHYYWDKWHATEIEQFCLMVSPSLFHWEIS